MPSFLNWISKLFFNTSSYDVYVIFVLRFKIEYWFRCDMQVSNQNGKVLNNWYVLVFTYI